MALKCNCVTVRRDFDNESAGRREVLFPIFLIRLTVSF